MILAIDGYEANIAHRVGIGRYAYEIIKNLYVLLAKKSGGGHTVRIYLPDLPNSDMPAETPWWQYRTRRPGKLWTFIGLPIGILLDGKVDVVFSPTHYIPRFITTPRVLSIMDMSFLKFPEMFRKNDLYKLTNWTSYSATHAKRILTISKFSKNAIINAYGVPEERVVITYPGLTMDNHTVDINHDLSSEYILSVGTLQPRKNYVRLIEAFSRILPTVSAQYPDLELVIIGKKGWLFEEILNAPEKFEVEDKVKFLEFVSEEDLPVYYQKALCFVQPSLYEGFGLPVLEAMAYGCPVVVSNASSLPEIAQKAGVYVEAEDVESIAQGLKTTLTERNSKAGKQRIQEGLSQAKKFTWEKAAKDTLAVLEEVGGGRIS